jgi:DegV family protein with EDD domain
LQKIAVVTDTSACLPPELVKEYQIEVVPMELIYEGKVSKDEIEIKPREFYELLAEAKNLPTTSAPSPQVFVETYKKLAEKTESILVITPSSKFSHVYDSASIAARQVKAELVGISIEVVDCMTAAGAQGLIVLDAARHAMSGKNLAEISNLTKSLMCRVHLVAFLDTLYYLAIGGRVPQIIAWGNSLLAIKPLFELIPCEGKAVSIGIVRTRKKAIAKIKSLLNERLDGDSLHTIVMHSNALFEAEELKEFICSNYKCEEAWVRDFTPVMGVHTGPGLLAVAYYSA